MGHSFGGEIGGKHIPMWMRVPLATEPLRYHGFVNDFADDFVNDFVDFANYYVDDFADDMASWLSLKDMGARTPNDTTVEQISTPPSLHDHHCGDRCDSIEPHRGKSAVPTLCRGAESSGKPPEKSREVSAGDSCEAKPLSEALATQSTQDFATIHELLETGASPGEAAPKPKTLSKTTWKELLALMKLPNDLSEAKRRQQHMLELVEAEGFPVKQQTWHQGATKKEQRRLAKVVWEQTREYGHSARVTEAVIAHGLRVAHEREKRRAGKD